MLTIETPDNAGLFIRNIGNDVAVNIMETTGMFRDIPVKLWHFTGPISYANVKCPNISRQINFFDHKLIRPQTFTIVRLEYENTIKKNIIRK